jgi:TonB family protein
MTPSLMNVAAYSVQVGVLVAAAAAIMSALRVRAPRPSLHFWQAVLAVSVLLPIIQPRADLAPAAIDMLRITPANAPIAALPAQGFNPGTLLIYVVAAGIVVRLAWLAIGFARLRRIVADATPSPELQPMARELAATIGATSAVTLSDDVRTPATVGVWRPLILLPRRILEMAPAVQRAVIAHELVHVRRRDWLHTLLEEFWCAILWFHPAARLLASRLSLSREMVVDEATLALTRDRRAYAEALLAFSPAHPASQLPGVTSLIGRRQLSQRISLIAEEEVMSRRRVLASFAIALFVCAAATVSAVGLLPMTVIAAQAKKVYRAGDGITLPAVIYEVKPDYTREAMQQGIQGSVVMAVVVLEDGDVGDIRIASSLDAEYGLDSQAVSAMRQWKFRPGSKDGKPVAVEVHVQMTFTLK